MKKLIFIAAALLICACANDPTMTSSEPAHNKEYRTGSNIPTRNPQGVTTASPEEVERARAAAQANMGKGRGN